MSCVYFARIFHIMFDINGIKNENKVMTKFLFYFFTTLYNYPMFQLELKYFKTQGVKI